MNKTLKEILSGMFHGTILSIAIILLNVYGCSGTPAVDDKEVTRYVEEFEKDIGLSADKVDIYFDDLKEPRIGVCYPIFNVVKLDKEYFKNASSILRKALVYHELGHCVCQIYGHVEGKEEIELDYSVFKFKYDCDKSIMSPSQDAEKCLLAQWDKLVKDLRNRCK